MTDDASPRPAPGRYLPGGLTADAVAEARRLYETTDESLQSIAARFGISRWMLSKLAQSEGWKRPGPRGRLNEKRRRSGRRPRAFTPEALAYARQRYEDTDEPQASIAADYGMHRRSLDRLAEREGWKLRKNRPPCDLPASVTIHAGVLQTLQQARDAEAAPAPTATDEPTAGAADAASPDAELSLALRLERAVERHLRKVEALREDAAYGGSRAAEAERIARTLAALTQTLFKVRQLRDPDARAAAEDEGPADADGFRDALARRIETFVRSRDDDGVPAPGAAAGADAAGG